MAALTTAWSVNQTNSPLLWSTVRYSSGV